MDAQELRGMAVVAMARAERLGRVADVLFETQPLKASALVLHDGKADRVLDIGLISQLGPDAIITRDRPVTDALDRGRRGRPSLEELAQLKVVDETGRFIGYISSVQIDRDTGSVSSVDVQKRELLGFGGETQTVDRGRIVAVGADLVTVRTPSVPTTSREATANSDVGST